MKAVIYARYSSDNQREESIEGQLRECMEYAERHGMTIVDTYIDRALSAKTDNRPRFQAMIKDSSKQLFEVVLVWKLDRFARNRFDSAVYKNKLKKNGVRVVSAREAIAEGADGILLEAVLEGYAEYFSVDLAEKVSRGMKENALKCKNNGSVIPLGYYVDDDQHLQIDEKKAPYVREIFGRYANGETIKDIVYDMNIRGATITVSLKKANDGRKSYEKPLNYNMIHRMLRNRKYIGEYKFSDVIVPGGVPAIVDLETFNRAQERMKTNKSTPAKQKAEEGYLLTTKLFCGKCKAMMVGESGNTKTGKKLRYYKCATQKRKHTCDKKTVRKEYIEDLVCKHIMDKIMDDQLMDLLADRLFALQLEIETRVPEIEEEIRKTDEKINNLVKAIETGPILEPVKKRIEELTEIKKNLQLEVIKEELENPVLSREEIMFGLCKFRNLDITTQKGKQILIDGFVNSIYLYDDYFIITCNYKDGTNKVFFEDIENSDLISNGSPKTSIFKQKTA